MLASMRSQRASVSRAAGPQRTSSVTQAIKAPMQYLKHSLAGLAMFASAPMARAADLTLPSDINIPDIALSSDITALVADNPAVAGGAVVAVAAAVVAAVLSGGEPKPKAVATQVDQALEALTTDEKTVLVDIRSKADVKVEGTPDIRATKKKLLSLPYVVVSNPQPYDDHSYIPLFRSQTSTLGCGCSWKALRSWHAKQHDVPIITPAPAVQTLHCSNAKLRQVLRSFRGFSRCQREACHPACMACCAALMQSAADAAMLRTLTPSTHPHARHNTSTTCPLTHHPHLQVSGEEVAPDAEFAAKFSALPGITPESIIILIDSTGEEAASAAATLFASEELSLQKVFYVKVRPGLQGCRAGPPAARLYGSAAVVLCAAPPVLAGAAVFLRHLYTCLAATCVSETHSLRHMVHPSPRSHHPSPTPQGGAASWQEQGAPWRAPSKGLDLSAFSLPSLSLPNIDSIDALAESYKANPSLASAVLSLAAIGGVATFIISEFEVLLEVVGVLAAGQFLLRYLLFADDREKTFNSIK